MRFLGLCGGHVEPFSELFLWRPVPICVQIAGLVLIFAWMPAKNPQDCNLDAFVAGQNPPELPS